MDVLVLGGGGFMGRAVCAALEAVGASVEAPRRADLDLTAPQAADALVAHLRPHKTVIMLAAVTPDRDRAPEAQERNEQMVDAIARAFERRPVAHCIFVSTTALYGDRAGERMIRESDSIDAASPYAVAKWRGEERLRACGVPLLVLRPSIVYGPGDTHTNYGPGSLVRGWREGAISLFGDGEDARDFLFVEDFARIVLAAAQRGVTGTVNAASGRAVSYAHLAEALSAIAPRAVTVTRKPRSMPPSSVTFETSLMQEKLGPIELTPLEDGLRQTWAAG